jgi:hypothetical protein
MVEQKKTRSFAGNLLALAGATVLLALTAAGCAAQVDTGEIDVDQAPAVQPQQLFPICTPDKYGHYTCPDNKVQYAYSAPNCGELTKPTAQTSCNNNCVATCVDSGWGH